MRGEKRNKKRMRISEKEESRIGMKIATRKGREQKKNEKKRNRRT
jgi:hypothetical protein